MGSFIDQASFQFSARIYRKVKKLFFEKTAGNINKGFIRH